MIRRMFRHKPRYHYHGEQLPLPAPSLDSHTYNEHVGIIDIEEASKRSSKAKGPTNLSMAWDDTSLGVGSTQLREGLLSERERKDTYYKVYIGNPWVRSCINVIGKRFTSGGWEIEPIDSGKGNEQDKNRLKQFLLFLNDDEDFQQHLRSISDDLHIFGEAFDEIVFGPDGLPCQLHKIDCVSMSTKFDQHGMITGYTQTLERSTQTVEFTPEQIIRWWLPDPRAFKKALSPIECIKDAVYLYQSMTVWAEKFFKQGARPAYGIELAGETIDDDAKRYLKFFKENYTGIQNSHVPPVTFGGAKVVEFGKGSVEMDFLVGRDKCRDEIIAGFNVPLSLLGLQESAHLGGGTGESANKAFIYNTVKPIEQLILEKINYRLVQDAFGIADWCITVRHADYRDDVEITDVQDKQIRNGSLMINEARQERGRDPIDGGDTAVVVAGKDIQPVEIFAELAGEHRDQVANAQQANSASNSNQPDDEEDEDPNKWGSVSKDKESFFVRATPRRGGPQRTSSFKWKSV